MMDDILSEAGRLIIGVLFTIGVIAACRYWPFGRKGKRNG
jgi:hypothetical protein